MNKKYFFLSIISSCVITIVVSTSLLPITTPIVVAQEEAIVIDNSQATVENSPTDGIYFADVFVKGKPTLQVGSLASLSAIDRAKIINRRIASIVSQSQEVENVEVNFDQNRQVATLQVNNRVIMTVTQQDSQDFGVTQEELANRWANRLENALQTPSLAIDVGQRLYGTIRQTIENTIDNLPSIIGAVIVIIGTSIVAKGVRFGFFRWAQQTEGDSTTEILIARLGYGAVWIVGSIITLGVLGLNFGALLGALGLTSVAIGFSLKDVLSNYISGVILLAARPFRIKDQVVIGNYEGTITQIQLRATTMKTYDGRLVYIPNQEIFQASITNNTASPRRRSSIMVGIDYSENIDRAIEIILQTLPQVQGVELEPIADV